MARSATTGLLRAAPSPGKGGGTAVPTSWTARVRGRTHLRPLTLAAMGVALVALDTRVRRLDVLPDPPGWLLLALGAAMLGLPAAARWGVLAAVLSLADVLLPYRMVALDPSTGHVVHDAAPGSALPRHVRWEDISDPHTLLMVAAVVAGAFALGSLLVAVIRRASAAGDRTAARAAAVLLGAVLAVWAIPFAAVMLSAVVGAERYDPVWNGNLEFLGLAAMVVLLAVAAFFVRLRDESWAVPPEAVAASRWQGNPYLGLGAEGPQARRRYGVPRPTRSRAASG